MQDPDIKAESSLVAQQKTLADLEAHKRGDPQALGALFERYLPIVKRIVASRIGKRTANLDDVDDIAQEAMLDAFRGIEKFEFRGEGTFRSWLAQLVQNRLVSLRRREHAAKRGGGSVRRYGSILASDVVEPEVAGDGATPSQVAYCNELQERREVAMLSLSQYHREVVNLRDNCEMSFAEMAEALDIGSSDAVRMAYRRASEKLREALRRAEQRP